MIEFLNVTKEFPGATRAVDRFNLRAQCGEITVLLGSSGCGKTTLLRMVNRMVTPTSGQILIEGKDTAEQPPVQLRRSLGYVMQDGGLFPHRRVIDNVATVPRLLGASRQRARSRALEMLELVGLTPQQAQRYPAELSGGQRQRVGVARALAGDAKVLLMDEPFGAVDPLVRGELQTELKRLHDELGKTILFVTHDINEALTLGDRIVVLREGAQITANASPRELMTKPQDDFTTEFLGLGGSERQLHLRDTPDGQIVIDGHGRPLGTLAGEVSPS